jgi:methylated-DNA-[protein]-cysteine S-methyltransferase
MMILSTCHTSMGWVALAADGNSLVAMTLPCSTRRAAVQELHTQLGGTIPSGENRLTRLTKEKLERYFSGECIRFDGIAFRPPHSTEFQRRVWQLTRAIPYGSTRTYQELARAVGKPHAARAVGQCMARNPLPIIVPCHRVLGTDGGLRGFGHGLDMKRALLEMEGAL